MIRRKDVSMAVLLNVMRRVESKVDGIRLDYCVAKQQSSVSLSQKYRENPSVTSSGASTPRSDEHMASIAGCALSGDVTGTLSSVHEAGVPISFSQYAVLKWPAIRNLLPSDTNAPDLSFDPMYVVAKAYAPLPMDRSGQWLSSLPLARITSLSRAFFDTFNPNTPIMKKIVYSGEILNVVTRDGCSCDIESRLVMNVLALSRMAVRAHQEGDFPLQATESSPLVPESEDSGFIPPT